MIPQIHVLSDASAAVNKTELKTETSHFVALLSLGRALRIFFWLSMLIPSIMHGDLHSYYIGAFIIPDIVYTIIMGDFLYVWFKIMRRKHVDGDVEMVGDKMVWEGN